MNPRDLEFEKGVCVEALLRELCSLRERGSLCLVLVHIGGVSEIPMD